MDAEIASTALAAIASLLAAVSAWASWRATRAVERNVRLTQETTQYQLFRSFEDDYSRLYSRIWEHLGPWDDPVEVDDDLRRVVHDLLQILASIHVARQTTLIQNEQGKYLAELYFDWLRLPKARAVWEDVFRRQDDTWPRGFGEFVEQGLGTSKLQPPGDLN